MNTVAESQVDLMFQALADQTRRDILRRVLLREHSISGLAAVQKHVAVLERAGLLVKRRRGREMLASGQVEAVRSAVTLLQELEALWRGRVTRMDDLLAQDTSLRTTQR